MFLTNFTQKVSGVYFFQINDSAKTFLQNTIPILYEHECCKNLYSIFKETWPSMLVVLENRYSKYLKFAPMLQKILLGEIS